MQGRAESWDITGDGMTYGRLQSRQGEVDLFSDIPTAQMKTVREAYAEQSHEPPGLTVRYGTSR